MGACQFYEVAGGVDAASAFNAAVQEAQYMNGHGGYTGSIAEKGDFINFTDQLYGLSARADAYKTAMFAQDAHVPYEDTKFVKGKWVKVPYKAPRGRTLVTVIHRGSAFGGLLASSAAAPTQVEMDVKVPPKLRELVAKMALATDDKWGAAGCLEIRGAKLADYRKRHLAHENQTGAFQIGPDGKSHKVGGIKTRTRQRFFVFFGWASE